MTPDLLVGAPWEEQVGGMKKACTVCGTECCFDPKNEALFVSGRLAPACLGCVMAKLRRENPGQLCEVQPMLVVGGVIFDGGE